MSRSVVLVLCAVWRPSGAATVSSARAVRYLLRSEAWEGGAAWASAMGAHGVGLDVAEVDDSPMDRLAVELGLEIVKLVPGYVSTEVDIRASFDTAGEDRRAG